MPPLKLNLLRTDQAAESLEELCLLNGNLAEPDHLENALEELQLRLSELEEPRLIEIAIRTRYLEWCAFILRGMCASELRRRYSLRLVGGRGKRDQAGEGIQAQMTRLATSIGVSPTTLMTDVRISDTFFSSAEDTTIAREHTLPREFYVIALSAPIPHEAIIIAAQYAPTVVAAANGSAIMCAVLKSVRNRASEYQKPSQTAWLMFECRAKSKLL